MLQWSKGKHFKCIYLLQHITKNRKTHLRHLYMNTCAKKRTFQFQRVSALYAGIYLNIISLYSHAFFKPPWVKFTKPRTCTQLKKPYQSFTSVCLLVSTLVSKVQWQQPQCHRNAKTSMCLGKPCVKHVDISTFFIKNVSYETKTCILISNLFFQMKKKQNRRAQTLF